MMRAVESNRLAGCRRAGRFAVQAAAAVLLARGAPAETFSIPGPLGQDIDIEVSHAGPEGSLVTPAPPRAPGFGPPAIFSAPLPSGSGARALGLAGAFTAIADDATAASWNPGGLTQLERPEASAVFRASRERNLHASSVADFRTGTDRFDDTGLNYFSSVLPFQFLDRNWVFSANYQEAYDFEQNFNADLRRRSARTHRQVQSRSDTEATTKTYRQNIAVINVTTRVTTDTRTLLTQILESDAVTELRFAQDGVVDALSPALAVEFTPKLSAGTAVNFYDDSTLGNREVQSTTVARYSGASASRVRLATERRSQGTWTYDGIINWPPPFPPTAVAPQTGLIPPFYSADETERTDTVRYEGTFEEHNVYRGFEGMNVTLGCLGSVSRHLGLGAMVDLPWLAEARQTKDVRNTITTYDRSGSRVLDVSRSATSESRDVEFRFPLHWAVGGVWRWNDRFYTSLDLSQTMWSDFYFQAEGDGRINPIDGSAYGRSEVDDCWSTRVGMEYLWVFRRTEVPLRAGASWEQRPAIGDPDDYWAVSLGTGISMGMDPGKLILDVAYLYTWGDDVLGSLVPGQEGLTTDVRRQDLFVSGIWHF